MRAGSVALIALALLAGSAIGVSGQEDTASISAGCDKPIVEPGDYEGINDVDDDAGRYWVVVPESYGQKGAVPLVVWLSSGGGFADSNAIRRTVG